MTSQPGPSGAPATGQTAGGHLQQVTQAPLSPNLGRAAHRIDSELRRNPNKVMSLRSEAATALEDYNTEFLANLGEQSIRLARAERLRTVDEEHVHRTFSRLGLNSDSAKMSTAGNTLGSLIAGLGLASAWDIFFDSAQHSTAETITVFLLCMLGIALVVFSLTVTLRRGR
jgi:hypothetical protein